MKKILIILDGVVAKTLLKRIIDANTIDNAYDVIYMHDVILSEKKPSNFTFYKFDPTSLSKLEMVLDKNIHTEAIIALNSKDEMINVVKNIRTKKRIMQINVLDYWGLELEDSYVSIYKGIDVLANGMVERLPNIPVVAQNIGLRQGEIMEVRIPFGSSYAYRYIGSIEQREWKIFGVYRNEILINVKPSLILKPNDLILIIGKPEVLMQVYNAIGKTQGQFPMPFGHNIYLYLDLFALSKYGFQKSIEEAKQLNKKLKIRNFIVKVTRPTNVEAVQYIKEELKDLSNVQLEIDYKDLGFKKILQNDAKRHDIGVIVLSYELLRFKDAMNELLNLKIPIFKVGHNEVSTTKETFVLLNDTRSYEQISPIIFDVASQLKTKTKIFNMDPIGDEKRSGILDHFENLAKIFNQRLEIESKEKNPIRKLKQQENILQILPLKKAMFEKRYFFNFFYINSDLLAFDINSFNQLLIPIVETNGNKK